MGRRVRRGSGSFAYRCKTGIDGDTQRITSDLNDSKARSICILNKIDTVKRHTLLALTERLVQEHVFVEFFVLLKGDGVKDLGSRIINHVPKGPWHFPGDQFLI